MPHLAFNYAQIEFIMNMQHNSYTQACIHIYQNNHVWPFGPVMNVLGQT